MAGTVNLKNGKTEIKDTLPSGARITLTPIEKGVIDSVQARTLGDVVAALGVKGKKNNIKGGNKGRTSFDGPGDGPGDGSEGGDSNDGGGNDSGADRGMGSTSDPSNGLGVGNDGLGLGLGDTTGPEGGGSSPDGGVAPSTFGKLGATTTKEDTINTRPSKLGKLGAKSVDVAAIDKVTSVPNGFNRGGLKGVIGQAQAEMEANPKAAVAAAVANMAVPGLGTVGFQAGVETGVLDKPAAGHLESFDATSVTDVDPTTGLAPSGPEQDDQGGGNSPAIKQASHNDGANAVSLATNVTKAASTIASFIPGQDADDARRAKNRQGRRIG